MYTVQKYFKGGPGQKGVGKFFLAGKRGAGRAATLEETVYL